jgi:hypothetical protein
LLIESKSLRGDSLIFNDEVHSYSLNGKIAPSVTTINKAAFPESPQLSVWKIKQGSLATIELLKQIPLPIVKLPADFLKEVVKESTQYYKKVAQEAADIGSLVHDFAEQWTTTKKISDELNKAIESHPDREKVEHCIKKFSSWHETEGDVLISAEEIIGSPTHHFAGKYDSLSERKGKVIIRDYKTSSGIYVDQFVQMAAYKIMLKEWNNVEVDELEIVRFGKESGEFEVQSMSNKKKIKELEHQFLRNRNTYAFVKEFKL